MDNSSRSLVIEQEWNTLNESNSIADDQIPLLKISAAV